MATFREWVNTEAATDQLRRLLAETRRENAMAGQWQAAGTAGHETHGQWAIYDAEGRTIAIVYDGKAHAPVMAKAAAMIGLLREIVDLFPRIGEEAAPIEDARALLAEIDDDDSATAYDCGTTGCFHGSRASAEACETRKWLAAMGITEACDECGQGPNGSVDAAHSRNCSLHPINTDPYVQCPACDSGGKFETHAADCPRG